MKKVLQPVGRWLISLSYVPRVSIAAGAGKQPIHHTWDPLSHVRQTWQPPPSSSQLELCPPAEPVADRVLVKSSCTSNLLRQVDTNKVQACVNMLIELFLLSGLEESKV